MHEKACRTCSKIIFPLLTNQSIDCFTVVVSLTPCQAWFPYRCICRICRTKKINRTDTTLWKPPVHMFNTKETTDTTYRTR